MRIIGGNSKRRVEQRQEEAVARNELRWKRSPKQQLKRLDEMLGTDLGAVKERTRLLNFLLEKEQEVVDEKIESEVKSNAKSNEKTTKTRLSPKEIKKRRKQHKDKN